MGWASGDEVFDPVAQCLIDLGATAHVTRAVLGKLIDRLQDRGWDTEDESLEEFRDHPAIVAAFADNGVTLDGEDEDDGGEEP